MSAPREGAENPRPTRRSLLDALARIGAGASALAALLPLPRFLLGPPDSGETAAGTDAGAESDFPSGSGRVLLCRGRPCLVLRDAAGFAALSAVCTHLGCVVRFDEKKREIRCPCHGARYDLSGAVLSGPTRIPLPSLPVRVANGRVVVGA